MQSGASSVAHVEIPGTFPRKWDLADQLPAETTKENLQSLLKNACPVTSNTNNGSPVKQNRFDRLFKLKDDGVYYRYEFEDERTGETRIEWRCVCSYLEVAAETRDARNHEWGRLLIVEDRDGHRHEFAMPMSMLAGDGTAYRQHLLSLGLVIAPGTWAREWLHEYISTAKPGTRVRCVPRIGWHSTEIGQVFVLPDQTFGETGEERVLLQSANLDSHLFMTSGTIAEWQANIGEYCVGNSRMILCVSTAFAAALMNIAGEEGGGINFQGASRCGKTTTARAAGSVWGGGGVNGYLRSWRATSNGLESVAELHCDALLCLDEMGQVDAAEAGEIA